MFLLDLLFGDFAVIPLQLRLRAGLDAEVRHLALAALTVLAGAIFAAVDRALRATPDVFAHPAVEFILGALALRHMSSPICCVPKDFGSFPGRTIWKSPYATTEIGRANV